MERRVRQHLINKTGKKDWSVFAKALCRSWDCCCGFPYDCKCCFDYYFNVKKILYQVQEQQDYFYRFLILQSANSTDYKGKKYKKDGRTLAADIQMQVTWSTSQNVKGLTAFSVDWTAIM